MASDNGHTHPAKNRDMTGRAYEPGVRIPSTPLLRRRELPPLDVTATLHGKNIIIVGGTGFLGKVLVGMLLHHFPDIGHIYLMVRAKGKLSPKERFEAEVWPTPCFDPLRSQYPLETLYQKLTPIAGDVVEPLGGVSDALLQTLIDRGIDAVLNVAGVVSFDPPLDEGLSVNVLGLLNLMELCRRLRPNNTGDARAAQAVPLLHTSTCYVAGQRSEVIWEDDPRDFPFPYAHRPQTGGMERSHWDPQRELDEGMAIAKHLRGRANDAQMQSQFLDRARKKLRDLDRPTTGEVLQQAIKKERDKWIEDTLGDAGTERARHWGWPNTYTYTKSIGEQLLAASGQPYTIVRPAIVESSIAFPFRGWNEGINTSAPLIYLAIQGQVQVPTRPGHVLDVIPVDMVCAGTILSAAALLRGEAAKVYQYGSGDVNPLTMFRITELSALFKRRFQRQKTRGNPLVNRMLARNGPVPVTPEQYRALSSPAQRDAVAALQRGLKLLKKTPLAGVARNLDKQLGPIHKQAGVAAFILDTFVPFMAEYNYVFRCDNTRAEMARLVDADRSKLDFSPDTIDWREYWIEVHIKGLRKWVFPHLEAKLMKRPRAEDRFSDLLSFLDEIATREGNRTAVQHLVPGPGGKKVLVGISYKDLRSRAHACAARLADVGVHPGDRVALVAKNAPEWAVAFFGILQAGASVVPLDPTLSGDELARRMKSVDATMAIVGDGANPPDGAACLDLRELVAPKMSGEGVAAPEVLVTADDVAVIAFTAGTTGVSKPVVLTHKNITAVLASIAPLFKITDRDSGLSVLPLTHTFELTCGLLLPLLRGARVTYVDDVTAANLSEAFATANITAMIGVPQVWEELEEKIKSDLAESGPFAEAAFRAGVFFNRTLGKTLGINLGRVLFAPVHDRLGGRIRFMVSTGGPVPKRTADTFKNLGIELKQSYGLTEATPVLAMGDAKGGAVVPGVQVEIRDVLEDGVGEIVAKGDAVMRGYLSDDELSADAIAASVSEDGWLRTGDLGRIDKHGRITVVARHNEVITLKSGKRLYPRQIEDELRRAKGVLDLCVVGLPDGQGGERVACLIECDASVAIEVAEANVATAARKLPDEERPSLIVAAVMPLPRTSDRKVKRPEVIAAIIAEEAQRQHQSEALTAEVVDARLPAPNKKPTFERLAAPGQKATRSKTVDVNTDNDVIAVPAVVRNVVKQALTEAQRRFYHDGMRMDVEGQDNIPFNRQTIVAANHQSHLDMGAIKVALGSYGDGMIALAAKDYFFEGKWRRAYFENFTNLRPLDRDSGMRGSREAMREASGLVESGHTILIFPEGTRSTTGEMTAFRPAVAYLALKHGVDILPVYVDGTHRAMPRGAYVPKNRNIGVRIGEPIPAAVLQAAVEASGLRPSAASQKLALVVERAVTALRDGRRFVLEQALDEAFGKTSTQALPAGESETGKTLREIFVDLEKRFQKESVNDPLTYYFSLGDGKETKWTVQVDKDKCRIVNDKVEGKADCVFKTDAKTFTEIIRDHRIPDVSEFINGTIKTNDPELLTTFLSIFNI